MGPFLSQPLCVVFHRLMRVIVDSKFYYIEKLNLCALNYQPNPEVSAYGMVPRRIETYQPIPQQVRPGWGN